MGGERGQGREMAGQAQGAAWPLCHFSSALLECWKKGRMLRKRIRPTKAACAWQVGPEDVSRAAWEPRE